MHLVQVNVCNIIAIYFKAFKQFKSFTFGAHLYFVIFRTTGSLFSVFMLGNMLADLF